MVLIGHACDRVVSRRTSERRWWSKHDKALARKGHTANAKEMEYLQKIYIYFISSGAAIGYIGAGVAAGFVIVCVVVAIDVVVFVAAATAHIIAPVDVATVVTAIVASDVTLLLMLL